MNLAHARILLTGASGGLGSELARQLAAAGAPLLLAGRDAKRLETLRAEIGAHCAIVVADMTHEAGVARMVDAAREFGVNVLINNAGASAFGLLEQQDWNTVTRVVSTSLDAPIHLTQALLPWLRAQPQAAIVNIGSAFGNVPFAGFAAYSAAKAGLRAFSQALRRELADTTVSVTHVAPRAIDTAMNSDSVTALNRRLGNHSDPADLVARQIIAALRRNARELNIGFPERLFAWVNAIAPRLIDRGVAGKLALIKLHAQMH